MIDGPARNLRRKRAYRTVFATEEGKTVLADLYRFCGVEAQSFANDPCQTAFNEGRRRVALRIAHMIRHETPDDRLNAMEEEHAT